MYELEYIKNAKGLHIAHLNVRRLVNKWDNIKANFMDSGIHILAFSETWLHSLLPSTWYDLGHEYTLLRNDRNWNDMYVKSMLQFSEYEYSHLNKSSKDIY